MEQQFSLSWREFHGNLSAGCARLLGSGEFADVTLAAEGKLLQAHRLVLSICSPYFQKMFHANPCQHPIVVLKDISYNALKDLLQFMYNGEVSVKQEDLTNFISTAESLEIKGLTNNISKEENTNGTIKPPQTKSVNLHNSIAEKKDTGSDDVLDDSITNSNVLQHLELINQLNNLASLKRKTESFLCSNKNDFTGIPIQPEKRPKLREKQILNRHKITNNHIRNIPNNELSMFSYMANHDVPHKDAIKEGIDVVASNSQNKKNNETIEIKKETDDVDIDSAFDDSNRNNDLTNDDNESNLDDIQLPTSPIIVPEGVDSSYPDSPSAPWPCITPSTKGVLPYFEHKIVTIPQKEDGKKKYPQKSCRYCWRAGRRRDTRFMCEQCCVPLCKMVCFERHLTHADQFLTKERITIVNNNHH